MKLKQYYNCIIHILIKRLYLKIKIKFNISFLKKIIIFKII